MMITQMNRQVAKQLRAEIDALLPALAEKLGMSITTGRGIFTGNSLTLKVEFALKTKNGEIETKDAAAFKVFGPRDGFAATDLFREFVYGGKKVKIIGYRPRLHRSRYIYQEVESGRNYRSEAWPLKAALGIK